MAGSPSPVFDRNGKYLYFTASTNSAGSAFGLDMTSDLLRSSRSLYAMVLAADTPSPLAPESDDEKTVAAAREQGKDNGGDEPAKPEGVDSKPAAERHTNPAPPPSEACQDRPRRHPVPHRRTAAARRQLQHAGPGQGGRLLLPGARRRRLPWRRRWRRHASSVLAGIPQG